MVTPLLSLLDRVFSDENSDFFGVLLLADEQILPACGQLINVVVLWFARFVMTEWMNEWYIYRMFAFLGSLHVTNYF